MASEVTDIDRLVRRYGRMIERYLLARVGSETLAEDLRQEVLVRAWLRPPVVECEAQLRAWLFRVADNLVVDAARSPSTRALLRPLPRLEDVELVRPVADTAGLIDARNALEALRAGDRLAVMMHACGYSLAEVGTRLGISTEAARKRVARARTRLRRVGTTHGDRLAA